VEGGEGRDGVNTARALANVPLEQQVEFGQGTALGLGEWLVS
jgi:hypothetical protein